MSTTSFRGHTVERFHVEGHGQVHIGDRYYSSYSTSPLSRFHNKHFEVPRNPSPVFTGREELRILLRSCFPSTLNSQQQQKRFVVYGLGGSGKTQVCLKFAEEHRENTESLERGYLQIAKVCSLELQVDAVKRWLSNTTESWALILDNADDPRLDISPYFPVGNRGVVLITTRNPECRIHATVGAYQLGAMEPNEAVTLIMKTTGVEDQLDKSIRASAKQVVATLGHLALAIVQAGAVIRQGRCKMEEYCALYHQRRHELLSQKAIQDGKDYRYTVYTTWEVSLRMIEEMASETGRDAVELLHFFSFLHHDGISEEIFHRAWRQSRSDSPSEWILSHQLNIVLRQKNQEWNAYSFRAALSILQSFSLINRNKDDLISIHPLVHVWSQDRLSPSDQEMIWTQTISTIALSIPWTFETSDYQFRRSVVLHVDACLRGQNDGIFHLRDIGNDCMEIASKFALAYREASRLQEAFQLTEQVVEARKMTLGNEHPETLDTIHNLAVYYREAGRWQEALQLMEQVLEAKKRTQGEEHPDNLPSIHNLAIWYSEAGQLQEAMQLSEQVVEARKKTLGEDHPNTLGAMHGLAIYYSKAGQRQKALQLMEQVVEARKKTLGEKHPGTLQSILNLAVNYREAGRQQEALQLTERVVEVRKRTQGKEHPDSLDSMHNLAICYNEAGRRQEALQLMEQVVKARKRTQGEDHPDNLPSMHNLAIWYSEAGQLKEALQLSEQVVEARKRTLGEEHPDTLGSMHGLAICYSEAGRRQEALQLSAQLVEARKKILGDEHPDTLDSIHNLAVDYTEAGRRQEALQLLEQIVDARKRTQGEEHPATFESIHDLAIYFREAGGLPEALQLSEKVMEARKSNPGDEHPDTLDSIATLAIERNARNRNRNKSTGSNYRN